MRASVRACVDLLFPLPHATANARPSPLPPPPSLAAPQDTWVDEADWRAVVLKALTESDVNKRLYKAGGAGRQ